MMDRDVAEQLDDLVQDLSYAALLFSILGLLCLFQGSLWPVILPAPVNVMMIWMLVPAIILALWGIRRAPRTADAVGVRRRARVALVVAVFCLAVWLVVLAGFIQNLHSGWYGESLYRSWWWHRS